MAPIGDLLLAARAADPRLQHLRRAFGPGPTQQPPAADLIDDLGAQVGRLLGLTRAEADEHHTASPWRHRLVAELLVQLDTNTMKLKNIDIGTF